MYMINCYHFSRSFNCSTLHEQIGIHAFGNVCELAAYTNIAKYRPWIMENLLLDVKGKSSAWISEFYGSWSRFCFAFLLWLVSNDTLT